MAVLGKISKEVGMMSGKTGRKRKTNEEKQTGRFKFKQVGFMHMTLYMYTNSTMGHLIWSSET